jgi:hypothetical protein
VNRELVEEERAEAGQRAEGRARRRGSEDHGHEEALPDPEPGSPVLEEQREDHAVGHGRRNEQLLWDRDPCEDSVGRRHPGI